MVTQSPFSLLSDALGKLGDQLKAPAWLVDEVQHRTVLFINHVLMQEPEAQARLKRQSGRVVRLQWRDFSMQLAATPAGLWELAPAATPDLLLTVTDTSPFHLAKNPLRGDKPGVRIEGDVQFAAEVNWLIENVRWDAEEDLSRFIGDAPAHAIGGAAGRRPANKSGIRGAAASAPVAGSAARRSPGGCRTG